MRKILLREETLLHIIHRDKPTIEYLSDIIKLYFGDNLYILREHIADE